MDKYLAILSTPAYHTSFMPPAEAHYRTTFEPQSLSVYQADIRRGATCAQFMHAR